VRIALVRKGWRCAHRNLLTQRGRELREALATKGQVMNHPLSNAYVRLGGFRNDGSNFSPASSWLFFQMFHAASKILGHKVFRSSGWALVAY
jgi:hypothetical protein